MAAPGHSYSASVVAATCTQGGYTVNECTECGYSYRSDETPAAGHTASDNYVIKDGKFVKLCVICNEVAEEKDAAISIGNSNMVVYYKMTKSLDASAPEGKIVYSSSDPSIVKVDENGRVTGVKTGTAEITATVEGTDISETCRVEVRYAWWQWLIRIFLLGFLWY